MEPTTKFVYTVDEVADMLRLHSNTVRNMLADGRLERVPGTGRHIRISAAELEAKFGVALGGDAA